MASHTDILDRIVIASLAEMPVLLDQGIAGAVITASEPDMLTHYEAGSENLINATAMMERIVARGIPHYKSGIFHPDEADKAALKAKLNAAPANARKAIRQDETARQVRETLAVAEELLEKAAPKKLAIHCQAGSDRSGMLGVLLLLHRAGGTKDIDRVLTDFARVRPQALLRVTREDFKAYFGDEYERFHEAVGTYRDAVKTTGEMHKAYSASGLLIDRDTVAHSFNIAGVTDASARVAVAENVERYNRAATRFGLSAYTIAG